MAAAMPLNPPMQRINLRQLLAEFPQMMENRTTRTTDETQARRDGIAWVSNHERNIIERASSLICAIYGWPMGHSMALYLRNYADSGRPAIFTSAYWRWPLNCLEHFFNCVVDFVGERLELVDLTESNQWALEYSFDRENTQLSQNLCELYGRPAAMGFNALLAVLTGEGIDAENAIMSLVRCEYGNGSQWAILPQVWDHGCIVVSESH
jgi:hypothetical protein